MFLDCVFELWFMAMLACPTPPATELGPYDTGPPGWQARVKYLGKILDINDRESIGCSFSSELQWHWNAYQIAKDCPPSNHRYMFAVDDAAVDAYLVFNLECREYLLNLRTRQPWRDRELDALLQEYHYRHSLWSELRNATRPDNTAWRRRASLQVLLDHLGPEAFYAGRLPGWVPFDKPPPERLPPPRPILR